VVVLLDRHSEVVGKDDLIAEVWPDTHVEDGNLRVHITALRRALGDDDDSRFIRTVPGRGYRFIAPVSRVDQPRAPADAMAPPTSPQSNLPVSLTRMFGRSDVVGALAAQLPPRRAVTIVGPGGIGKTTVALAAAEALAARYPDGVHVVDLVPVAGPPQLAASFAEALGLAPAGDGADLIRGLIDRRMLIVFDNCEQLIGPTAELIERICRGTSHVHVLATSREPLRHADEWVRRLPPLRCPPPDERLSAEEALAYPAIELFVDRMSASDGPCGLDDDNAATVAAICRRLDGVPLAIELAANRVHAFGIKGLMAQLDEPLRLLSGGRRTADARHQTLSGMLDWSYRTLSEPECAVLRRLAIFPDEFTLAAACAVAGDSDGADVVEGIAALVSKSLVIADVSDATTRYRLLATTRNYALAKLTASGELDAIARRHAEHAAGQVVSA
jgi:predicted ATPase